MPSCLLVVTLLPVTFPRVFPKVDQLVTKALERLAIYSGYEFATYDSLLETSLAIISHSFLDWALKWSNCWSTSRLLRHSLKVIGSLPSLCALPLKSCIIGHKDSSNHCNRDTVLLAHRGEGTAHRVERGPEKVLGKYAFNCHRQIKESS